MVVLGVGPLFPLLSKCPAFLTVCRHIPIQNFKYRQLWLLGNFTGILTKSFISFGNHGWSVNAHYFIQFHFWSSSVFWMTLFSKQNVYLPQGIADASTPSAIGLGYKMKQIFLPWSLPYTQASLCWGLHIKWFYFLLNNIAFSLVISK